MRRRADALCVRAKVCAALAQIAKHSVDLAEVVVEAEIFPNILNCLKDGDSFVRKNAATCIREVSRPLRVSRARGLDYLLRLLLFQHGRTCAVY